MPSLTPDQKVELDPYVHVPDSFITQSGNRMFPHATIEDLAELGGHGWSRFGVATAIVNERGEILMLEHAESPKHTEGSLGPLMETSRVRSGDRVESTEQTMHRGIQEELGLENPRLLQLKARLIGAWTLHKWPVGDLHQHELALGVNPVVLIPDDRAEKISQFIKTEEIRYARWMSVEAIMASERLRPGVIGWLGGLTSRGLLDGRHDFYHPVNFDDVDVLSEPGWADAVFANL